MSESSGTPPDDEPGVAPEPETPFSLECVRADDGAMLLVASGELDSYTAPRLRRALEEAASASRPVRLDLAGVSFMDSAGLAAVIAGVTVLDRAGAGMRITAVSSSVARLFQIAGVARQLHTVEG